MRALVQRVAEGSVSIGDAVHANIGRGFVVFLGIRAGDTKDAALYLAEKCAGLRAFEDASGKMNLGLKDVGGSVLIVSQFTLYAETQRGNRPGFTEAARPEEAIPLYELFVEKMKKLVGHDSVKTGVFRTMMKVTIVNDGPVTMLIESRPSCTDRPIIGR